MGGFLRAYADAIQWVTGPFTLVAFLAFAWLGYQLLRMRRDRLMIRDAPDEAKENLIQRAVDSLHLNINLANLTRQQKYELTVRQLQIRERRFLIQSIVAVVVGLMLVTCFIASLFAEKADVDEKLAAVKARVSLAGDGEFIDGVIPPETEVTISLENLPATAEVRQWSEPNLGRVWPSHGSVVQYAATKTGIDTLNATVVYRRKERDIPVTVTVRRPGTLGHP